VKVGIIAISAGGRRLAGKLEKSLDEASLLGSEKKIRQILQDNWSEFDGFICIMACGIVVRSIGDLIQDKKTDPCLVVMDEKGLHAISLLSGHIGGGNALAREAAAISGGKPVITTASDTLKLTALDLWAREQGLAADNKTITRASSILVNRGSLQIFSEVSVHSLPHDLIQGKSRDDADLIISSSSAEHGQLVFHPRNLVIGVGCNRNTPLHEFELALAELLNDENLSRKAIYKLASIDKKNDEHGLLAFARNNDWPLEFFSKDEINKVKNVTNSAAAMKAVGAIGVAEPCALLSAAGRKDKLIRNENEKLICRKRKWQNITMAIAQAPFMLSEPVPAPSST